MEKPVLPLVQQQAPWLAFFSHGRCKNTHSFFNVVEGKTYVGSIREVSKQTCLAYSHGWLLMMHDKTKDCSLINPRTKNIIQLPPLLPDDEFPYDCYQCFVSSEPTDQNCVVLFVAGKEPTIMFCHPTDSKWRKIDYEMDDEGGLWDFVTCKGKLYGDTWMGRLAVVEFDPDPIVRLLNLPERPQPLVGAMGQKKCLVESCGEIFTLFSESIPSTGTIITFRVYKADLVEEKWVHVQSFGDRAFFLCNGRSVSCSASESGIKGNSIYYVRPGDTKLYRYDMAQKSISMEWTCPNLPKYRKEPQWIFI